MKTVRDEPFGRSLALLVFWTGAIRNRVRSILKYVIWRTLPDLAQAYYRRRRLPFESIVLLIHEGLGDMVSLAAGIRCVATEHKEVYVVTSEGHFRAADKLLPLGNNVKNIVRVEGKVNRYRISSVLSQGLEKFGHVIRVGYFDCDPVFDYPNSFYIKLGCDTALARTRFPMRVEEFQTDATRAFLKSVCRPFVFFSGETTDGRSGLIRLEAIESHITVVMFTTEEGVVDSERIRFVSEVGSVDFCRRLLDSICACLEAEYILVSDAGLFNILIRLALDLDIRVMWRKHKHSLSKEIYGKYIEK